MTFDIYFPHKNKEGKLVPGFRPKPMTSEEILFLTKDKVLHEWIKQYRDTGDKDFKEKLPAICFVGKCQTNYRLSKNMLPTQFVMIDIDHCDEPLLAYRQMAEYRGEEWLNENVLCAFITPSGKGLRWVFIARESFKTLEENMTWFRDEFQCNLFGDFDAVTKDYARVSFLPQFEDILFWNKEIFSREVIETEYLVNEFFDPQDEESKKSEGADKKATPKPSGNDIPTYTDEEIEKYKALEYKGTPVPVIIDKYVEVKGTPGSGEIHNYYNEMVKNFRNLLNNDKRAVFALLPRFGHTDSECWSSVVSICKFNTVSKLEREFYFFLKDNGFYRIKAAGSLAEYMLSDEEKRDDDKLPWLPPVFREFIRIAPKDFRASMVNALLPVMGTLTSYLQAPYYYDGRMHTTSFFSIIYAPAGTGKGFVERIVNMLFEQLKIRDYVQQARENIFLNTLQRKGANEKAPKDPHVTMRIIPPKNSEAEFLQKMKDNCGYHMFTYAAEMDSWAKGVRAANGNKDDMIRVAWDNGEYGQQFKSANTFKGVVSLYWNVLITGTMQQLMSYFKNVENGLITRCSFTSIDNQEFAEAPIWKTLNQRENEVIKKFMNRCDENTYEEPCDLLPDDVDSVSDEKFDEEIKWRFTYKKRKTVDMEWLRSVIDEFLESQRKKAAIDYDKARDVFRRRVAVRGFRLGLMCYALWDKPRYSDLMKCIPFIKWWMNEDLERSLQLWGARYNSETETAPTMPQRSLYNELPQNFTKSEVFAMCMRLGIKTPVRNIIHGWFKLGTLKKVGKQEYEKIKPNEKDK